MKLALKVDVDTLRGTREGVPRLITLLKRYKAGATFLFSLGPDHTGRAWRRVFKKNFLSKVRRTSVLEHYGIRTLLYGTLLPGPDIGRQCADTMRATRDAGFEVGIHCWDHVRWQDYVARRDAGWTEREMRLACERFAWPRRRPTRPPPIRCRSPRKSPRPSRSAPRRVSLYPSGWRIKTSCRSNVSHAASLV